MGRSLKIDELLQSAMSDFLATIGDPDLNVRRVSLIALNSAAHNKPRMVFFYYIFRCSGRIKFGKFGLKAFKHVFLIRFFDYFSSFHLPFCYFLTNIGIQHSNEFHQVFFSDSRSS